jgi:hypothetical protein
MISHVQSKYRHNSPDEINKIIHYYHKNHLKNNTLYDIQQINTHIHNNKMYIHPIHSIHPFIESTFTKTEVVPYDVHRIRKKGIRIINNVYQRKYNYNQSSCTGLGDFIRGSYFILEFCEKYKFVPKIVFNHMIGRFLNIKTTHLHLIQNILAGIGFFKNNNCKNSIIQKGMIVDTVKNIPTIMADFVEYVENSPMYYGNVFLFCNSFPMNHQTIPEKHKQYMKKILEPTYEMKHCVDETLSRLHLSKFEYSVIHIRSGDDYLKNTDKSIETKYFFKLLTCIKQNSIVGTRYLIIADNNQIKILLKQSFPEFQMLLSDITHFGEGIVLEKEKVKNSLIDFYLLSFSQSIQCYSSYEHGSGFSLWCAETYNIPYSSRYIPI